MNDSGFKPFLLKIFVGSIPVQIFIAIMAYFYFFEFRYEVGDIGSLGKLSFDTEYYDELVAPKFKDLYVDNYKPGDSIQDIVTFGDSFSQQGINGFQNYLAHRRNRRITNVVADLSKTSPAQMAIYMLESGLLDNKAEFLVLEIVERHVIGGWSSLKYDEDIKELPIGEGDGNPRDTDKLSWLGRLFKQGKDWMKIGLGFASNPIHRVGLSKACFGMPQKENMLYFYDEDLMLTEVTDQQMKCFTDNLLKLDQLCKSKNIKLIFCIVPDKYEVYQHLTDHSIYPEKKLGVQISNATDTLDFVVNPRIGIIKKIDAGEKDVYFPNDTHWSYKGASFAADMIYDRIMQTSAKHH